VARDQRHGPPGAHPGRLTPIHAPRFSCHPARAARGPGLL
jgi:hypothetical protein